MCSILSRSNHARLESSCSTKHDLLLPLTPVLLPLFPSVRLEQAIVLRVDSTIIAVRTDAGGDRGRGRTLWRGEGIRV